MNAQIALDANEALYFNRQLEHIKSREIEVKKGDLRFLDIFPVATDTPRYAETVTYYQYDARGIAKIISSYADDLPSVEVDGKSFTHNLKEIGIGYEYNISDIRRGAIAGTPLQQRKANQARRGTMEKHNKLFWLGDADAGIVGLMTHANVTSAIVPNGAGGDSEWDTKTPQEILNDLTKPIVNMLTLTKGIERPDTYIMTPAKLEKIKTTRMASDTRDTVMDAFKLMYPEIQFFDAQELAGAFDGGTEGFIVGRRSDEYIESEAPIVYESLPPQPKNLSFKVPAYGRNGGVKIYYPLAFAKYRGI